MTTDSERLHVAASDGWRAVPKCPGPEIRCRTENAEAPGWQGATRAHIPGYATEEPPASRSDADN